VNIKFPAKFMLALEFSSADDYINDKNRQAAVELLKRSEQNGLLEKITYISPQKPLLLTENILHTKVILPGIKPLKKIIQGLQKQGPEAILLLEYAGIEPYRLTSYINNLISLLRHARRAPEFIRIPSSTAPENHNISGFEYRYNKPAHRTAFSDQEKLETVNRTLIANMTGQVTLAGDPLDLHFKQGSLQSISRNQEILFSRLNSRTRFITSGGVLLYRNESSFSFEDNFEYGLRTLQIPKLRKKRNFRVITDFTFDEKHKKAVISMNVDYPVFEEGLIIFEAAVFETPLFDLTENGIEIISDKSPEEPVLIKAFEERKLFIPGSSFKIKSENKILRIEFPKKLKGHRISPVVGLPVRTGLIGDSSVLYINPCGSYTPAPSEHYSGIREQLCFTIGIEAGRD
jgi:hypothetical protein